MLIIWKHAAVGIVFYEVVLGTLEGGLERQFFAREVEGAAGHYQMGMVGGGLFEEG